jgi:hypothetical protein
MTSHPDRLRATLARLRRVNRAIAEWDEYEAARALPEDVRALVPRPTGLGRRDLVNPRGVLMGILGELHAGAGWEAWLAGRRD